MPKTSIILIISLLIISCSCKNTEQTRKTVETEEVRDETNEGNKLKVEEEAMYLLPFAEKLEDGNVRFYMESRRNWKPTGEYIPDGEHFIIEIYTQKGNVIWSSSHGMNFTQAIGEVQPQTPGYMHVYEKLWDGKDNKDNPVPAGEYLVKMTIPAKPMAYSTKMNFEWNPNDK